MAIMSFLYDIIETESFDEDYDSLSFLDHVLQHYAMGTNTAPQSMILFLSSFILPNPLHPQPSKHGQLPM